MLQTGKSPTCELLFDWGTTNCTVGELVDLLVQIELFAPATLLLPGKWACPGREQLPGVTDGRHRIVLLFRVMNKPDIESFPFSSPWLLTCCQSDRHSGIGLTPSKLGSLLPEGVFRGMEENIACEDLFF